MEGLYYNIAAATVDEKYTLSLKHMEGWILSFVTSLVKFLSKVKKLMMHVLAYRSLFASKSIQTGECIMRVPYNVVSLLTHSTAAIAVSNFLTLFLKGWPIFSYLISQQIAPDNLLPKVASLLDNEVGNVAKLAIVILIEQKRGQVNSIMLFYSSDKK